MSVDGTRSFQANSHGLTFKKERGGLRGAPLCKQNARRKAAEGMSIGGASFLEADSHGSKFNARII